MDGEDHVGLRQVQLVVALVDEHAPLVEDGAHRPIHDVDGGVADPLPESLAHVATPLSRAGSGV